MPNFMQTASFQAPTDYNVEAAEIARRKAMAQALQQQAMQPQETQMAGGWAIPRSPLENVAGLAKTLSGHYQEKRAVEDEKRLAESANKERQQAYDRIAALGTGSPDLATDPAKVNLASLNTGTIADTVPELQAPAPKPVTPQQRNLMIAQVLSQSRLPDLQAQGNKLMIEALTKENNPAAGAFAKINPKDFTADSVAKFGKSQNYADLVPRVKMEAVNLGGETRFYNPYDVTGNMTHTVTPDTNARLANTNYWNQNLTANQYQNLAIDRARLANQGIEAQYNTGQGVGSPMFSGLPQNAPMQTGGGTPAPAAPPLAPQAPRPVRINPAAPRPMGFAPNAVAPNGQPVAANLPPKLVNDIAADSLKQQNQMNNKRTFNMQGINGALDEAESILTGQSTGKLPTSSGVGSMVDSVAGFFGASPSGAAEADKLRSIGGALVAKMPRMEGPQSDKDVQLYREMAGQVGDASIPIQRRLAALQTVRQLYAKYEGGGQPERRSEPRNSSNRVVVDF